MIEDAAALSNRRNSFRGYDSFLHFHPIYYLRQDLNQAAALFWDITLGKKYLPRGYFNHKLHSVEAFATRVHVGTLVFVTPSNNEKGFKGLYSLRNFIDYSRILYTMNDQLHYDHFYDDDFLPATLHIFIVNFYFLNSLSLSLSLSLFRMPI
jgi:hypothetical protein